MKIFEAGMLLCFGIAWPLSIIKSYRSRSTGGKSVFFSFVILLGYVCGIIHKLLNSRDIVLVLYILNFLMVGIDTCLWFRNRKLERQAQQTGH